MTKEVGAADLFDTLRIYLGSLYVNDFNRFGRTWQVVVQADPVPQRDRGRPPAEGPQRRGDDGPARDAGRLSEINGPLVLTRYNMYPAAPINGAAAPGVSSGEAIATDASDSARRTAPAR